MRSQGNHTRARTAEENDQGLKKGMALCIITIFIVFSACALFGNILSSAHSSRSDRPVDFKYYTSIKIQQGDTLWDIAAEYITEDYKSIPEYIQALREMNSLNTNDIEAGQNLMVAYNDTKFVK